MEAASFQSDFTRVGIALNGRRGHISCHLERKSGSRWAKGPAREGGASQQCGRRDHAGLCAGGGGGEVTGHRKGTKQPGRGPSARVPHLCLCSGRLFPQRELRVCAAPLVSLAAHPVPGRTTLRLMSHAPWAIAILPGTPLPLRNETETRVGL